MITGTQIVRVNTLDPWWNLAVEEYLLEHVEKGMAILYLWQNQNTVVIGKNQNPWRECRTELLEKEEGKLARRLSGGGAVFHDIGNLNFTFAVGREDYDLERQVRVILAAVRKLGIEAEMTGRNDITVNERKFSGNAFCFRKYRAYHHGTIMVSADMSKLARYLQVSEEKMRSKGVQSVQSRVINLSELQESLTIEETSQAMMQAFREEYGRQALETGIEWMDKAILDQLYQKYSSWEWRYGEAPKFDIDFSAHFTWGGVQVGLNMDKGRVAKASVYSDAMDEEFIDMLPQALQGATLKSADLAERIRSLEVNDARELMVEDIAQWISGKEF